MRIAMIGHKRIPSREGGIEIVIEELSVRMAKKGHQVTCYNRAGHHVSGKEFDSISNKLYKNVRLKSVPCINARGLAAMTSSFFGAIMIAFGQYDVVHFHAEGPCAMMWIPKLLGKRCIATIHGLDHQREKWGRISSWYIMLGEKIAIKYADEIIVLSKSVQEYFKNTYGRKTVFIPNGVDRPQICEENLIGKKFALEKDGYLLYLGRLVPEKGLQYLIKAFMQVKTDKKLVIAGGSSDTVNFVSELKKMAKKDKRIIFTGFVQGKMLGELYSNCYIYVLPSDLEGMPLSLLEAMSYGNCCVVSDIDECTEVVDNKAVIFKKSDINDLAKKMQILLENEQLTKQYKSTTAEFICNKYNWDRIVDKTLEIYRGEK